MEKRLAQSFGLDSDPQRINPEAVLKRARWRATTRRLRPLIRVGKGKESVTQNDVEDLEKLKRFRAWRNQPLAPAVSVYSNC